jgi:acyl-CoA thioester hydrolase
MRSRLAVSLDPADYVHRHDLRVRFAETDAMGIVHHAAYLPYLEAARVEYLREIGHPYASLRAEGIDIAVLEASVRYLRPLRFDEIVTVHLVSCNATRTTFELDYLLTVDGRACSTALTAHACVNERGRPVRLPSWLAEVSATRSSHR